jgi:hypothetical protein
MHLSRIYLYFHHLTSCCFGRRSLDLSSSGLESTKYVCSYICKPECDDVNQSVREAVSNLPSDASTKKHLCTIGNVFLTHRQFIAQEAAFEMCGLPLRGSSKQTVYVDSRPEEERSRLLLPKQQLVRW